MIKDKDTTLTGGSPAEATHYKGGVEPLEMMASIMSKEEFIGFLKGNAIKYAFRAGRKAGESAEKDRVKFEVYSQWLNDALNVGVIHLSDNKIINLKVKAVE